MLFRVFTLVVVACLGACSPMEPASNKAPRGWNALPDSDVYTEEEL